MTSRNFAVNRFLRDRATIDRSISRDLLGDSNVELATYSHRERATFLKRRVRVIVHDDGVVARERRYPRVVLDWNRKSSSPERHASGLSAFVGNSSRRRAREEQRLVLIAIIGPRKWGQVQRAVPSNSIPFGALSPPPVPLKARAGVSGRRCLIPLNFLLSRSPPPVPRRHFLPFVARGERISLSRRANARSPKARGFFSDGA